MARYKTHYEDLERSARCKTTHRVLLPLVLTSNWDEVTCAKCLRHRPAAPVSWLVRFWQRIRGTR